MNPATRESKPREITVPRRGVKAEAAALPLEVGDEDVDDAELTATGVGDLVRDGGEEEGDGWPGDEDVRVRRRLLAQSGRVRRLAVERNALTRALAHRRGGRPRLVQDRARLEARLLSALCGLGLSRRQIEQVASGLYAALERAAARRIRLQAVEQRTGRSPADLLRLTHGLANGAEGGELPPGQRAALHLACHELGMSREALVTLAEEIRNARRELAELDR